MRFKFIAIFLVSLATVSFGQRGSDDSRHIRVMTFNIRYNEPRDGVNAWPNRKQKVADVIRFHKADLVGMQEAQIGQLEDLEKLLPAFAWCGVGRTDGKRDGEFSAILYRKDRFKLIECKTFWLSETPDKPGSKGWDAAYPRIVTSAKFRDRRTGKTFFHFNTHFDHVGTKARYQSAKMIIGRIHNASGGTQSVLTGDLNVTEDTEAYKTLTAADSGLKDARYISRNGHFGGTSTFNAFKEMQPGRKIDFIFVTPGITVFEHGVLSDNWNGLWASDHLPVLAEIGLR
ncbi:MAG: endonuclease/exonuclease/phosphatase family protein [Acidobacteria bacterium]|nr:endonuclease/exonuclease/phosphatase family protein [Acidobacteriota bacterium]